MRPSLPPLRSSASTQRGQPPPRGGPPVIAVERRARPRDGQPARVRAQLQLRLHLSEGTGPEEQAAEIQELLAGDLSTGGVFVQCLEPPAIGERATVEVCRPGGGVAFVAQGRVAWRRSGTDRLGRPPGFGLSFDRLDVRDAASIRGIMDLLQRQQALRMSEDGAAARDFLLYSLGEVTHSVRELLQMELPPEIATFVQGYAQVSDRDAFLWRWAYQGVCVTTLSCVDPQLREETRTLKLLAVMFAVLLDDAADRAPQAPGSPADLLEALCRLWTGGIATPVAQADRALMTFAQRVHGELIARIENLGRYQEFADLLRLDMQQLAQSARYQLLLRRSPHFTSETEARSLQGVGIPLTLGATIDLCASPSFDARETGLLREVLGYAQRMAHTGHLLTSWERQLSTGDLTSSVLAHGLATGTLAPGDLDPVSGPLRAPRLIGRLRDARVDSHFLTEWLRDRFTLRELAARLRSVDVGQLLSAQQRLMWLQLSSRGLV